MHSIGKKSAVSISFLCLLVFRLYSADLTVNTQTFLDPGTHNYDNVTINDTLICKGDTVNNSGVIINCVNFTINSTGFVTAEGQGYAAQQGPGKPPSGSINGGCYGGIGGAHAVGPGMTYGSITNPTMLGSGGGNAGTAGGAIKINASGDVVINGVLSANGALSAGGAGGSGGSVYIIAKNLSGTGNIKANGGQASGGWGGIGGGGGRIAIYYETLNFNLDNISAIRGYTPAEQAYTYGGGGPGTIYLKPLNQSYGTLIIDQKSTANRPVTTIAGSYTFDTIWIKTSCIFDSTASINVTNIISSNSSFTMRVDGELNKNKDLTVNENMVLELNNDRSFDNVTIKSNGTLSHTANDTQVKYKIIMTIYEDFTIEPGGKIDVTGKGFSANQGPGKPVAFNAGGCYGGLGETQGVGVAGDTYGSETAPVDLGSGGGWEGGTESGGGAVYLFVWGKLGNSGSIIANGNAGCYSGSGGSVYIKATEFGGSNGVIQARGGASDGHGSSGRGGAGRIAVYYYIYSYTGTFDTGGAWATVRQNGTLYKEYTSFHLPPRVTSIDNPAYSSPVPGRRPTFKWTAPTDVEKDKLHFEIEITQDSSFATSPYISASTSSSLAGFQYSGDNGVTWQNYPSEGIPSDSVPAIRASFTVQQDLYVGNWYWRVRAKDVDGNGDWSERGLLPSVIGDLVVKITSPHDSSAVYDEKIKVEGVIEQSVTQYVTINGTTQDISVAENKFSIEVNLEIGANTITVKAEGVIGNYLTDTVTIYRLRIPLSSNEESVGTAGGTVRLEDWDGDPENDARIEIREGVLDKDSKVKIEKVQGDYPLYEIKIDGRETYRTKKKVRLVLSYKGMNLAPVNEDGLRIFHWDGVKWNLIGGEVDKSKRTVSCWTTHLSKYAIKVLPEIKDVSVNVSPVIFTPNRDGINDIAVFNVMLKKNDKVEIKIYDESGKIARIITEDGIAGGVSSSWDGADETGKLLESGIYVYNVIAGGKTIARGTIIIAK